MKLPYIKFYCRDWQANSELQSCSIAARGVWIEFMCIMSQSERFGYLERNGKPIDNETLARLIRVDNPTLNPIIDELERAGVFSRCETTGAIYSRRMVKDFEDAGRFAEYGKKGGNPSLKNLSKENTIGIPIPIPTVSLTLGVNPTLNLKTQFEEFWKAYPRKVGHPNAEKAYTKALKRATHEKIMEGLAKNAATWTDKTYMPHPTTWLNRDGWNDEPLEKQPSALRNPSTPARTSFQDQQVAGYFCDDKNKVNF